MKTRARSCFFAVAVIASALSLFPVDATDAWGKFVAHVVQISDSSGNVEVHVVRTPEAAVDWDAPSTPYAYGPVTYHFGIEAPEFTARGLMYEVADPPDADSFVDFAPYSNSIPISAGITADVTMSPLTEDDTIHWEDPDVRKDFQTIIGVNGPAQFSQDAVFPPAGGSGTVGGIVGSNESFIPERGDPFITDLSTHLPEWGTNPALREVNRFDLSIQGRVLRQTGGDPEVLRSLASFVLSVTTIYELVLEDPDPFPGPDPDEPYLEVIAVSGRSSASRAGRAYQAAVGMKLQTADRIVTEPGSTVSLRYPDGVVVEVKGGSDFAIEALNKTGPTPAEIISQMKIDIGEINVNIRNDKAKSANKNSESTHVLLFGSALPDAPVPIPNEAYLSESTPSLPVGPGSVQPYEGSVFSIIATDTPVPSVTIKVSTGKVEVTSGLPGTEPFIVEKFETIRVTGAEMENLELPQPRIAISQLHRFPTTRLGRASRPQQVTIHNDAGASFFLADLSVGITGRAARDFRLNPPARTTLAPGESMTEQLVFRPRVKGVRRATMSVRGNAALIGVPLSGTGKSIAKPKK